MTFKRENRYLVVKREDITKYLKESQQAKLNVYLGEVAMRRIEDGKQPHGYVVVSDDWPEYETVFQMIEDRVEGRPNEIDKLMERIAALEADARCIGELMCRWKEGSLSGDEVVDALFKVFASATAIDAARSTSECLKNP